MPTQKGIGQAGTTKDINKKYYYPKLLLKILKEAFS
jgi:hypothetical protein